MNTICRYCCFKEVVTDINGKSVQTGCKLNRIAHFKEQGAEVVSETAEKKMTYFKISRLCNALRTETWAKKNHPLEDIVIRGEIAIQTDLFVLVNDNSLSLKDIEVSIDSIAEQNLLPKSVRVILNIDNILPTKVLDLAEKILPTSVDSKVEQMAVNLGLSKEYCINSAVDKSKMPHYAVFNAGYRIPNTFLWDIDEAINGRLERFCLLEATPEGNGLFVQTALHRLVCGYSPVILEECKSDDLVEKARYVAGKQGKSNMVRKVSEICRGMY
jgi:hypothetical protein